METQRHYPSSRDLSEGVMSPDTLGSSVFADAAEFSEGQDV